MIYPDGSCWSSPPPNNAPSAYKFSDTAAVQHFHVSEDKIPPPERLQQNTSLNEYEYRDRTHLLTQVGLLERWNHADSGICWGTSTPHPPTHSSYNLLQPCYRSKLKLAQLQQANLGSAASNEMQAGREGGRGAGEGGGSVKHRNKGVGAVRGFLLK